MLYVFDGGNLVVLDSYFYFHRDGKCLEFSLIGAICYNCQVYILNRCGQKLYEVFCTDLLNSFMPTNEPARTTTNDMRTMNRALSFIKGLQTCNEL